MTFEGICITLLSVVTFCQACCIASFTRRLNDHNNAIVELGKGLLNLAIAARTLGEQDVKLLSKIEEHDAEFIRKDEAN
jgi:hypothetical protein